MFGFLKKKDNGKRRACVFVDYEHWYYGYNNNFHMKPNIEEWIQELQQEFTVTNLYIFGDFSEKKMGKDMERLKKLSTHVIHTASSKDGVDKDFTDVIMLDHIYRSAAKSDAEDVYVLFTGDAHFLKVVEYLRELKKKVIIYGVKFGFSNALKSAATSYVEMPRQSQEKNYYYDMILTSLARLRYRPKTMVTYWKTVQSVADYNRVPKERVQHTLDDMIKQKFIRRNEVQGRGGRTVQKLEVDWKRLADEGIWES